MTGFDYLPDDNNVSPVKFPWSQVTNIAIAAARSRFLTGSAAVAFDGAVLDYYLSSAQTDTTLIIGFAVYENSSRIRDMRVNFYTDAGSRIQTYFTLTYTSDRAIHAFLGNNVQITASSPNVLPLDAWHYIGLKVFLSSNAASGIVAARINGVTLFDVIAKTDNNSIIHTFDRINLPNTTGAAAGSLTTHPALDDIYILNSLGSNNTTFLGDVRIDCYKPIASGTYTEFTPTGSADNWNTVDEIPVSTADYISTTVSGSRDSYVFQSLADLASQVFAVDLINYAEKTGSQTRQVAPIVVSGTTIATGIYQAVSQNSYVYQSQIFNTNPIDSNPWVTSGLSALQFGVITT